MKSSADCWIVKSEKLPYGLINLCVSAIWEIQERP